MVRGCVDLLRGFEVDGELVRALGGPPAAWTRTGAAPGPDYWLRVWALRGLLWVWDDSAAGPVATALGDGSWRVREMAAKVVARHRVDEALEAVALRQQDDNPRVRRAADRALRQLAAAGDVLDGPEPAP